MELSVGEVHIWFVRLDVPSEILQPLTETLSLDERRRAERFRFDRDRHRFLAGRGTLRAILSRYAKTDPTQIQFHYGTSGKPALVDISGLEFNLSHSQDLMLCAIARNSRVGVDLEYLRPVSDLDHLTQRFFSPQEYLAIQALPEDERLRSFFQYWTCKEALLKAIGDGLVNLKDVEILLTEAGAEIVRLESAFPPIPNWSLYLFAPAVGYTAALATEGGDRPLYFWQWQSE
ncbi:4'-phosphopantetheinyl transferase family protein [Leptothermofonsia sp. ETS-13]|uniref:4'-phosphopantetheinyl transferase family protein n=1 Tax=Leptothermofonsia sp. ETS-13 TaxID=3035696 RepID=UPI003BA0CEC8